MRNGASAPCSFARVYRLPPRAPRYAVALGSFGDCRCDLRRHVAVEHARDHVLGAQVIVGEATFCLPLGSLIDLSAETARLEKAMAKCQSEIDRVLAKLSNEKFVANAKPELVEAERERLAEFEQQKSSLQTALDRIADA